MKPVRLLAACALLACSGTALAAAPTGVRVEKAWIRWLPANLPSAAYVVIVNSGNAPTSLTGASSPDYAHSMLMHSLLAQDDSRMVPVARLDVPAHGSVKLAPGGYHIMLSGAKRPLKPGDKVPMTLKFADGTTLQVDFSMLPANSTGPSG